MGKLLFMALLGIIIASVVNMFVGSSGLDLILSYVGVLVFVGLTAYDTQKIKQMCQTAPDAGESAQKLALIYNKYDTINDWLRQVCRSL